MHAHCIQPCATYTLLIGAGFISFKNLLQEHTQKTKVALPHYKTERTEEGYVSTVSIQQSSGGQVLHFTSGGQSFKQAAEQEAAKLACTKMGLLQ